MKFYVLPVSRGGEPIGFPPPRNVQNTFWESSKWCFFDDCQRRKFKKNKKKYTIFITFYSCIQVHKINIVNKNNHFFVVFGFLKGDVKPKSAIFQQFSHFLCVWLQAIWQEFFKKRFGANWWNDEKIQIFQTPR